MPKTFTPLRYPGGKSQFYNQVANILSYNNIFNATYIEPFAGGAGVGLKLLLNGLVNRIVINDIDVAIYAFWHTVVNNNKWLINKIKKTPISINEWNKQKTIYMNPENYSLKELGFATLFLNRCNRSGILYAGPIGGKEQKGKYKIDCRFNKESLILLITEIGKYKDRISVYNYDALHLIQQMKNDENAFWFIDPPYYVKGAKLYKNFYNKNNHEELSNTIKNCLLNQSWILTYDYQEEIYHLYKEFKHEIITLRYTVKTIKKEKEYLFYNNLIVNKSVLNSTSDFVN